MPGRFVTLNHIAQGRPGSPSVCYRMETREKSCLVWKYFLAIGLHEQIETDGLKWVGYLYKKRENDCVGIEIGGQAG